MDSTNTYAIAQAHAGLAAHGMAWFAMQQINGRGQRGKVWQSLPAQNILLSIAMEPPPQVARYPFLLSAYVAITVADFLAAYTGNTPVQVKWPNDLYITDKKAGGILIENIYSGNTWKWAVAGIGININQLTFDNSLPNPVSLKQITSREYDVLLLANDLYNLLMKQLNNMDPHTIMKTYNQKLYKRSQKVKLKKENRVFETIVKSVNEQGQLLTEDGMERCFDFGEVQWVL